MHTSAVETQALTHAQAIGFAMLFAVALLGQVLGLHWRSWLPGAENMKSLTAGVESGVYTFMSHIL